MPPRHLSVRTRRTVLPRPLTALVAAAAAAAVVVTGSLVTAPQARAASSDIVSVSAATRAADAQKMLGQINSHRASKGLKPVKYSPSLSGISQGQSDRLVRQEVVNHANTFLTDRRAAGYDAAGEIHALSFQNSVTDLTTWWKGSPAHNKVLTDPRMEVVGIGLTYVDGRLSGTGQGWRLVGTVDSYGFPGSGAPADTRSSVTGGAVAPQSSTGAAATVYSVTGGIRTRYLALGGSRVLGTPTTPERGGLVGGGVYQSFRTPGGAQWKILWSPRTGAHAVKESGGIGSAWKAAGFERGWGYPLTEEYGAGSEVRQRFSNGCTAHWSRTTGRTWVTR
ncbi:CAP domain-containing protein [Kocuria sp.]|uniref:CAP domain-containing protein n=1 Tax=Kocuria sp. TaxID=1871328 RepID=UPI0026DD52C8|nr:CAP domain-containing protein [Kocuria sp.]MDO4918144.1 CAP domain-containing protein [Kocuria sp.]